MIGPYRIEGYAIASADGMIADETGVMPLELQLDADKVYFEEGLEHAAAIVHGRCSQEIQPKIVAAPPADPDPLGRRRSRPTLQTRWRGSGIRPARR